MNLLEQIVQLGSILLQSENGCVVLTELYAYVHVHGPRPPTPCTSADPPVAQALAARRAAVPQVTGALSKQGAQLPVPPPDRQDCSAVPCALQRPVCRLQLVGADPMSWAYVRTLACF